MRPVTIRASEQLDTRWFTLVGLLLCVPLLLISGGWLLLGLIPLGAGCLLNFHLITQQASVDLVRSQSGRWYQVAGKDPEELILTAHWLWPHVVFLRWTTEQGAKVHRTVFRHRLSAARYSQLLVGIQQDKIEHDKQNSS